MTDNVERLNRRMVEFHNALLKQKLDPDSPFEEVELVDMLIKFIVYLSNAEKGIQDGIYIYMNEDGIIVNAEYFIKEDDDVTIISFDDEQLELIIDLFRDVFTINVQ